MLTDNEIFIITNENFKQQKTQVYGYKWLDNEGFFINVANENGTIHISRSCLAPYIACYKDNSLYCISNSINSLVLYLETQGKTLTKTNKLLSPTAVCYDTQVEEIKLIPIDDDIYINDTGLHLEKNNRYFSKPFNSDVIEDWFNSYKLLLNQIAEYSTVDLSGGQDSRIIYSMLDKSKINLVHNSKERSVSDYYIANLLTTADKIKLNTPRMNLSSTTLSNANTSKFSNYSAMDLFQFGKNLSLDYINSGTMYYHITGLGTNSYKSRRFMNDLKIPELLGTKYHSNNLISYYDYNVMLICPFTDSRLMSMRSTETGPHIFDYIYKNFIDEKYINIPFYNSSSRGQYYYKYTDYVFLASKEKIIERLNPKPDYYIEDITRAK